MRDSLKIPFRRLRLLLILLACSVLSCAPLQRNAQTNNSASKLIELSPSQPELQQAFNADTGSVRLLLILSPT